MIVWVFAGGGESEILGLKPFLDRSFPKCEFKLCTPIRKKPAPKFRREAPPQGYTGRSLLDQIKAQLSIKLDLKDTCDLIVIFDDLDYPLAEIQELSFVDQKRQIFEDFLKQIWEKYPERTPIKHIIGFAKPELESWVIADWEKTVGKAPEFRERSKSMQHWLVTECKLSFSNPEDFGLDPAFPQSHHQKLSNAIIQASEQKEGMRYSKQLHTARFIKQLDSVIAQQKCPEFRKFFTSLSRLTSPSKS
jgi:hypothetical protein